MRLVVMVAVLILALPAPASSQGHDHGAAGIAIVSDLGPEAVAHVGTPVHFTLISFGEDLVPDVHQDLPVRVLFQEQVLWETTDITGHDYDGMNGFSITFPAPGPFVVQALVDDVVVTTIEGTVVAAPWLDVELAIMPEARGADGTQAFRYELTSAGEPLDLLDAWTELWQDDQLLLRARTHADGEHDFWLRYPGPGDYVLRVLGYQAYPAATGEAFLPVVHEERFTVAPFPPAAALPPLPEADVPTDANTVVHGQAGPGFELIGTYDPFTRVGPGTLQHLGAVVIDSAAGHPAQHVDFEARLVGPRGDAFRSGTMHEHDGVFELATRQQEPGRYVLHLTAAKDDWTGTLELPYLVLPPVRADIAGPQTVTLDAAPAPAGAPGDATLSIRDAAGRPFAHGEIHTQVLDEAGRPLVVAKLHTHGLGDYPFRVALPQMGEHALRLSPFPLDPQPATSYDLGAARALTATEGPGFPTPTIEPPASHEEAGAPAFWMVMALVALAAMARRRT